MMETGAHSAIQCCIVCGRTLTDRALHDELEDQVLAAIRAEHPEWTDQNGVCEACVSYYRNLLQERATREERLRVQSRPRWPGWLASLAGKLRAQFLTRGMKS